MVWQISNLVRGLWACVWRRLQVEGVACNLTMKWREELGGKGNTWRESHVEARFLEDLEVWREELGGNIPITTCMHTSHPNKKQKIMTADADDGGTVDIRTIPPHIVP